MKLTVRYRAPDALRARSRTMRVRIARGADVPHPRVTDLRAVRRGGSIRVSWRVAGPIGKEKWPYYVTADATRAATGEPVAVRLVEGNRRRYTVTLRAGADARYVTVRTALEAAARSSGSARPPHLQLTFWSAGATVEPNTPTSSKDCSTACWTELPWP